MKFEHTVGSHSDDRGGESDNRCDCHDSAITRFEVIDHTKPLEEGGGRLVVVPQDTGKVIDYSIQDEGRTLKVFIKES